MDSRNNLDSVHCRNPEMVVGEVREDAVHVVHIESADEINSVLGIQCLICCYLAVYIHVQALADT